MIVLVDHNNLYCSGGYNPHYFEFPHKSVPGLIVRSVVSPLRKQADPRMTRMSGTLNCVEFFPLLMIEEEQVVSYWKKNGLSILVNCLREACPGTLLL